MSDGSRKTRAIVVATPDARVRGHCVAHLVQGGEHVVSISDFRMPPIGPAARASATLIVAETLLPPQPAKWVAAIRAEGWAGKILVLGADESDVVEVAEVTYLSYPLAIAALVEAL